MSVYDAMSRLADAEYAIDTAQGEAQYADAHKDRDALDQALDYLEDAEGAIADAREHLEFVRQHMAPPTDEPVDVRMRDLEGHGNLAGR